VLRPIPELIEGMKLPNLEDPEQLLSPKNLVMDEPITGINTACTGIGWFGRQWYPRCCFAGSPPGYLHRDQVTKEESMGLIWKDHVLRAKQFKIPSFDCRFNNGASPGLALPYLKGDESITLFNLTLAGTITFHLPNEIPRIMMDIGRGENTLSPVLQTVCIRTRQMQVDLVWRGVHEYRQSSGFRK